MHEEREEVIPPREVKTETKILTLRPKLLRMLQTREALRQGFLLMEILGPPVTKRRDFNLLRRGFPRLRPRS